MESERGKNAPPTGNSMSSSPSSSSSSSSSSASPSSQSSQSSSASNSTSNSSSNVTAFLSKLWRLVNDHNNNDLICWSKSGCSFVILNQIQFAKDLLPLYFKHSNMASFIRQLNMYGFRKIPLVGSNGSADLRTDLAQFYHVNFMRGQEQRLVCIKRKNNSSKTHNLVVNGTFCDEVRSILSDVKSIRDGQNSSESILGAIQVDNKSLWRDVAILRSQHHKQRRVIEKLIQFLLSLIQNRNNMVGKKRKVRLMINSAAAAASTDSGAGSADSGAEQSDGSAAGGSNQGLDCYNSIGGHLQSSSTAVNSCDTGVSVSANNSSNSNSNSNDLTANGLVPTLNGEPSLNLSGAHLIRSCSVSPATGSLVGHQFVPAQAVGGRFRTSIGSNSDEAECSARLSPMEAVLSRHSGLVQQADEQDSQYLDVIGVHMPPNFAGHQSLVAAAAAVAANSSASTSTSGSSPQQAVMSASGGQQSSSSDNNNRYQSQFMVGVGSNSSGDAHNNNNNCGGSSNNSVGRASINCHSGGLSQWNETTIYNSIAVDDGSLGSQMSAFGELRPSCLGPIEPATGQTSGQQQVNGVNNHQTSNHHHHQQQHHHHHQQPQHQHCFYS